MRIGLYSDSDTFAGTERHIFLLARGLAELGATPVICCPESSALAHIATNAGIGLVAIAKTGRVDFPAIGILSRMLRHGGLDIVHAHNSRTGFAAATAVKLANRGHCVFTQHFITPARFAKGRLNRTVKEAFHRWMHRRIDHCIAISDAVRDGIIARREFPLARMTVIPNGIELPDQHSLRAPADVRADLGIPADSSLVICTARLEPEKDVASLIAAFAGLFPRYPNLRCLIVGGGSQLDRLKAMAQSCGISNAVKFCGHRSDPFDLLNAADIFVLPSLAEPFGLAILEAMSLGKPVIATRAGGPMEIVVDQVTGLLVPPSDPRSLGCAIERLTRDPALRERFGRNGCRRFHERFTARQMSAVVHSIYQSLLPSAMPARDIPIDSPNTQSVKL